MNQVITNLELNSTWYQLLMDKVDALPWYSTLLYSVPALSINTLYFIIIVVISLINPKWILKPTINSFSIFSLTILLVSLIYAYSLSRFNVLRTYDENSFYYDMNEIENSLNAKLTNEQILESKKLFIECQLNKNQQNCYVDRLRLDVLKKLQHS